MHLPSAANEWHIPPNAALPKPPGSFFRREPEEEHETSYFAPSVKIFSRSSSIIDFSLPCVSAVIIARGKRKVKHLFAFYAGNFWKKGLQQRKKYAIIEESAREGTPLGVGGYALRTRGTEKISRETRVKILTTPKMYDIIYL